jgi:hypothetical protein
VQTKVSKPTKLDPQSKQNPTTLKFQKSKEELNESDNKSNLELNNPNLMSELHNQQQNCKTNTATNKYNSPEHNNLNPKITSKPHSCESNVEESYDSSSGN